MKAKLDENLSPSSAALFAARGHEAHSVVEQTFGGKPDERVVDACRQEQRALVTADLDFAGASAAARISAGLQISRLGSLSPA